jgi:putative transposase
VFSHEAVRDWETKLAPALAESLRRRRRGKASRSWYVDETYIKVHGHWRYLYRAIDRSGALVDVMFSEHRDNQYLNNRLEQDHRGVKGRYGPMRGFKCPRSAGRFCRTYDELRNFLRSRSRTNQQVSAAYRRFHLLRRTATVLSVLEAA